ncbi:MAG: hypothetical protein H5T86_13700 [Armatimonadetes bacterium]|nr:hypothetical protein [Armatimonadota bacterium]
MRAYLATAALVVTVALFCTGGGGPAPAALPSGLAVISQVPATASEDGSEREHGSGPTGLADAGGWRLRTHWLGIVGAVGLAVALLAALSARLLRAKGSARGRLIRFHALLAVPFALLAMAHGTVFFLHEVLEGHYLVVAEPGAWLCGLTFLLLLSGLGRWCDRRRLRMWLRIHGVVAVLWVMAGVWHVASKLQ